MSTLSVSNITTPSNTTPLVLSSANSQAAFVRVEAANNDIVFGGTTKFLGAFSSALFYSNSINSAYNSANAAYDAANTVSGAVVTASFNTANAAYGYANSSYLTLNGSLGSNWAVTNTVYGVANAAFASANNVAPQVTPAFNTANQAYSFANTVSASLGSNWTVTNTVYGVANTALPNTSSPTLAGTLTVSTSGVPQVINSTNSNTYKLALRDNGTTVGYIGGSSSTPFIVANSAVNSLFSVDNIGNFSTTGTITSSSRGIAKASMPAGSVIQVQRTESTAVFSSAVNGSWVATGISVSITPTSSTSKILVTIQLSTGQSTGGWATTWGVQRNGTNIGGGTSVYGAITGVWIATDAYGSDCQLYGLSQSFLDSPASTSAQTYQIMYYGEGNTGYLNRCAPASSAINTATGITTITAMEIAQ